MASIEGAGPSRLNDGEETKFDVEIIDDEEEGETAGSVLATAKGRVAFKTATYHLGRSKVTEVLLDQYLAKDLIHPTM
jgi:hypothetical protein